MKKVPDILPILFMGLLFVLVDLSAFLVAGPFEAAGMVAFENPGDPFNLLYFLILLLIFTAFVLLIIKLRRKQALRIIFLGATTVLSIYVLYPILSLVIIDPYLCLVLSIVVAGLLLAALIKKPEWYVIDSIAFFTAAGAIAMIGISLDIWIIIVLLVAMALYDAISVYKTKHMIDMADSITDLKLPVMFVIPKKKGYSTLKETKTLKEKLEEKEEREAFMLGVGDVVFPGILAVAAFHSLTTNSFIMALAVLAGTLAGFAVLIGYVVKGNPQAGLPLLCSGAIAGYLIAGFLLFGFPPL
jgi:presenilin-like A22 family membrane protease